MELDITATSGRPSWLELMQFCDARSIDIEGKSWQQLIKMRRKIKSQEAKENEDSKICRTEVGV